MFATDHAAEFDGLIHHRVGGGGSALHHGAIIGEHRNVDMDIAIAGMHVGGDDDATFAHLLDDAADVGADAGVTAKEL